MNLESAALFILVGVLIGIISGMLGIGGGVLVIPVLVMVFHFSHTRAVGTSLGMLIPPIGIFAFLAYYKSGNVDLPAAALLAAGFMVGAYIGGTAVNQKIVSADLLRFLFAFFLLYLAGSIIFAHSSSRVWAVTKTAALMLVVAAAYAGARLIGKHLERRFSLRETFLSGLAEPIAPDYEI